MYRRVQSEAPASASDLALDRVSESLSVLQQAHHRRGVLAETSDPLRVAASRVRGDGLKSVGGFLRMPGQREGDPAVVARPAHIKGLPAVVGGNGGTGA